MEQRRPNAHPNESRTNCSGTWPLWPRPKGAACSLRLCVTTANGGGPFKQQQQWLVDSTELLKIVVGNWLYTKELKE